MAFTFKKTLENVAVSNDDPFLPSKSHLNDVISYLYL